MFELKWYKFRKFSINNSRDLADRLLRCVIRHDNVRLPFRLPKDIRYASSTICRSKSTITVLHLIRGINNSGSNSTLINDLMGRLPRLTTHNEIRPAHELVRGSGLKAIRSKSKRNRLLLPTRQGTFRRYVPFLFRPRIRRRLVHLKNGLHFKSTMSANGRTSVLPRLRIFMGKGFLTRMTSVLLRFFKLKDRVRAYRAYLTTNKTTGSHGRTRNNNLTYPINSRRARGLTPVSLRKSIICDNRVARPLNRPFRFGRLIFIIFRPFILRTQETRSTHGTYRSAIKNVSTFCLSFISRNSTITLTHFISSKNKDGSNSALLLRSTGRSPRFLTKRKISTHDKFIRGRSVQFVSGNATGNRFLLRTTKRHSNTTLTREFCLPMGITRRVVVLLSNNIRSNNRRVRVLLRHRIQVRKRTSKRVPRPPTSNFMILRRVRATSQDQTSINGRRDNRSTRGQYLTHAIQPSSTRGLAKDR